MNITIEVTGAQVGWVDPDLNPLNTTDGNSIVSLDLTLIEVQVSNAVCLCVYTCMYVCISLSVYACV